MNKSTSTIIALAIYSFIFVCWAETAGCKKATVKKDPHPPPPLTQPINRPPGGFTIYLDHVSGNSASFTWGPAIDPDQDTVTYKIFLNDSLVQSGYQQLTYTFENLKQLSSYVFKVVATDGKLEVVNTIDFETKKYWLRFLSKVSYGDITGYSSQKTGQMIAANDGGYIIVGNSQSGTFPDGQYRMFTIKVDTLGNKIWQKYYNYSVGNSSEIKIQSYVDDGYILCGGNNLIKINNLGDLIWQKSPASIYEEINGLTIADNGEIFTVGAISFETPGHNYEAMLSKYDPSGNLLLYQKFSPGFYDQFFDIKITQQGDLIVLGSVGTSNSTADTWVLHLTKNGGVMWEKTYHNDIAYAFPESIMQTKEGNYVVTGFGLGAYDYTYFNLRMIGGSGELLWDYYAEDNHSRSYSIVETNDNNLVIAGGYQNLYTMQAAIYKFDKSGNKIWESLYEEFAAVLLNKSVIATPDGGYITCCQKSKAYNNTGETDEIYLFKTDDLGHFKE